MSLSSSVARLASPTLFNQSCPPLPDKCRGKSLRIIRRFTDLRLRSLSRGSSKSKAAADKAYGKTLKSVVQTALKVEAELDDGPVFKRADITELLNDLARLLEEPDDTAILFVDNANKIILQLLQRKLYITYIEDLEELKPGNRAVGLRLLDCYMNVLVSRAKDRPRERDGGLSNTQDASQIMAILLKKLSYLKIANAGAHRLMEKHFKDMLHGAKLDGDKTAAVKHILVGLNSFGSVLALESLSDFNLFAGAVVPRLVDILEASVQANVDVMTTLYKGQSDCFREIAAFLRITFAARRGLPMDRRQDSDGAMSKLGQFLEDHRQDVCELAEKEAKKDPEARSGWLTWAKLQAISLLDRPVVEAEDAGQPTRKRRRVDKSLWGKLLGYLEELDEGRVAWADWKAHWLQTISLICDHGSTWYLGKGRAIVDQVTEDATTPGSPAEADFLGLVRHLTKRLSDTRTKKAWVEWITRSMMGLLDTAVPTPDQRTVWEDAASALIDCIAKLPAVPSILFTFAGLLVSRGYTANCNLLAVVHERQRQSPGYLQFLAACLGSPNTSGFWGSAAGGQSNVQERLIEWIGGSPRTLKQKSDYIKSDPWVRATVLALSVQHEVDVPFQIPHDPPIKQDATDAQEQRVHSVLHFVELFRSRSRSCSARPSDQRLLPTAAAGDAASAKVYFEAQRAVPGLLDRLFTRIRNTTIDLLQELDDEDSWRRMNVTDMLTKLQEAAKHVSVVSRFLCLVHQESIEMGDRPSLSTQQDAMYREVTDQLGGLVARLKDEVERWCELTVDNKSDLLENFINNHGDDFIRTLQVFSGMFAIESRSSAWRALARIDRYPEAPGSLVAVVNNGYAQAFANFVAEDPFKGFAKQLGRRSLGGDPHGLLFIINKLEMNGGSVQSTQLTCPALVTLGAKGRAVLCCLDTVHHWRSLARNHESRDGWADTSLQAILTAEDDDGFPAEESTPAVYVLFAASISAVSSALPYTAEASDTSSAIVTEVANAQAVLSSVKLDHYAAEDQHFLQHVPSVDEIYLRIIVGLLNVCVREQELLNTSTLIFDSRFTDLRDHFGLQKRATLKKRCSYARMFHAQAAWALGRYDGACNKSMSTELVTVHRALYNDGENDVKLFAARQTEHALAVKPSSAVLLSNEVLKIYVKGGFDKNWESSTMQTRTAELECLKELALRNDKIQKAVLRVLVRRCGEKEPLQNLAASIIRQIAAAQGYPSVAGYLEPFLPFLVAGWSDLQAHPATYGEGGPTGPFPFRLVSDSAQPRTSAFESDDARAALTLVVLAYKAVKSDQPKEHMKLLKHELEQCKKGQKGEAILLASARIKAALLPLACTQGQVSKVKDCFDLLEKKAPSFKRSVNKTDFPEIVLEIIRFTYTPSIVPDDQNQEHDAVFTFEDAMKTIEHMANKMTPKQAPDDKLFSTRGATALLMGIACDLETRRRPTDRQQVMATFNLVVFELLKLDQRLGSSGLDKESEYFLAQVIQTWTRALDGAPKKLADQCCESLRRMCEAAQKRTPKALVPLARGIVCSLQSFAIDKHTYKDREGVPHNVTDLLAELIRGLDNKAVAGLDQFPAGVPSLVKLQNERCPPGTLLHEMKHFLDVDRHGKYATSEPSIQRLRDQLRLGTIELQRVPDNVTTRLAFELASICQSDAPREVKLQAANCIGELGPFQLSSTVEGYSDNQKLQSFRTNTVVSRNTDGTVERQRRRLINRNKAMLSQLLAALSNTSAFVIDAAVTSLGNVFAVVEANQAMCIMIPDTDLSPLFIPLRRRVAHFDPEELVSDVDAEAANRTLFKDSLWQNFDGGHGCWITRLVAALIKSGKSLATSTDYEALGVTDHMLWAVLPLCAKQVLFCEMLLPYIFCSLLDVDDGQHRRVKIQARINLILGGFLDDTLAVPRRSIETLIDALSVLGTYQYDSRSRQKRVNVKTTDLREYLDVDMLKVASAAAKCTSFFTAQYYAELWWHSPKVQAKDTASRLADCRPLLILAAGNLGEPDGIYGLNDTLDMAVRVSTYEHEQQWDKALSLYDFANRSDETSVPPSARAAGICRALNALGFESVCHEYMQSAAVSGTAAADERKLLAEYQHESAWRQVIWGSFDSLRPNPRLNGVGFDASVLRVLRELKDLDLISCEKTINSAVLEAAGQLTGTRAGEGAHRMATMAAQLESLVEARELLQLIKPVVQTSPSQADSAASPNGPFATFPKDFKALFTRWQQRGTQLNTASAVREPIVACRVALLRVAGISVIQQAEPAIQKQYNGVQLDCLREVANLGRSTARSQNSTIAAEGMKSLDKLSDEQVHEWMLEMSRHFWSSGETVAATRTIKDLLATIGSGNTLLKHRASLLLAQWLAETRADRPSSIIESHLKPAVIELDTILDGDDDAGEIADAHLMLAHYADEQYRTTLQVAYDIRQSVQTSKVELEKLKNLVPSRASGSQKPKKRLKTSDPTTAKSVHKSLVFLTRRIENEEEDLKRINDELKTYINLAIEHYLACLSAGDKTDLKIFRVCSLWFNNNSDDSVLQKVREQALPTCKWVPLIHQLAARLQKMAPIDKGSAFKQMLMQLVQKITKEHPHHCLLVLIALDNDQAKGANGPVAEILKNLSTESPAHQKLIAATQKLVGRYTKLANAPVVSTDHHGVVFRGANPLQNTDRPGDAGFIDGVGEVAVFTKDHPVCRQSPYARKPQGKPQYPGLVKIDKFDSKVDVAQSGLSKPKIVVCQGSDGKRYKELVKGGDDTKLDAVMQQVFRTANEWLRHDEACRRRNLRIGTYRVVPLSAQTGVLEWCAGTMPLAVYLEEAHSNFRPNDWTRRDAMKKIAVKKGTTRPPTEKRKRYREVCENFKPVMRHFFNEYFPDPAEWFERRLAYTRSVSTNSIIGYVLGIGDRHVNNILVNNTTGELIHIDFGVAFDQGRVMPTPELVPFRLTRDIVDGMGITGVEGIFRLCCEETLRVMRGSQVSLEMILEVFLDDPLYDWKLSADQMLKRQREEEDENAASMHPSIMQSEIASGRTSPAIGGTDSAMPGRLGTRHSDGGDGDGDDRARAGEALRVLRETRRKLDGSHDESRLSVAGHVNSLIQKATDERNLAVIFHGWQPYF